MPKPAPCWPAYKRIPDSVPVPLRTRQDGWTPVKQGEFIGWLAQSGSVAEAAESVGCSRASAYALRRRPGAEGFAAAWEVAASGGHADSGAWTLTRDRVAAAATAGVVRVVMRRGRYLGTRVMQPVSALFRHLAQCDRACAAMNAEGRW